jgi:hypothetical protein
MTEQEIEEKRVKLQQWGIYLGVASLLVSILTLMLNNKQFKASISKE